MPRSQRTYDHRLVRLVQDTGDITIATGVGVPRSTATGWLRQTRRVVTSTPICSASAEDLRNRLARTEARLRRCQALLRVLLAVLRIVQPDFTRLRVPRGTDKARLLRAVDRSRGVVRLPRLLKLIGLSPGRLAAWRRAALSCDLDDRSSCPRSSPAAPRLLADAGIENRNRSIDELIATGLFQRVIAMTEIRFSNSMIEAWWRVLKHNWLFLHPLDSVAKVRRLVEFYVQEHNTRVPHAAFEGQTPDEMYFGTGEAVPAALAEARRAARQARLETNRAAACSVCA